MKNKLTAAAVLAVKNDTSNQLAAARGQNSRTPRKQNSRTFGKQISRTKSEIGSIWSCTQPIRCTDLSFELAMEPPSEAPMLFAKRRQSLWTKLKRDINKESLGNDEFQLELLDKVKRLSFSRTCLGRSEGL